MQLRRSLCLATGWLSLFWVAHRVRRSERGQDGRLFAFELPTWTGREVRLEEFEPGPGFLTASGFAASGRAPKYFEEVPGDTHRLIGELAVESPQIQETHDQDGRIVLLREAFRSFHAFMEARGEAYWLASGSLLGQAQGGGIMPFDADVDVQVPLRALFRLEPFNRTLVSGRYYLDLNPNFRWRWSRNVLQRDGPEPNKIDARWVDGLSGLYIDVTALAVDWAGAPVATRGERRPPADSLDAQPRLQDKSVWGYEHAEISPLVPCEFEQVTSWCPAGADAILRRQYRDGHELGPHYRAWHLHAASKRWAKLPCAQLHGMYARPAPETCDEHCRLIVAHPRRLEWGPETVDDDGEDCCQLTIEWREGAHLRMATFWGVLGSPDEVGGLPELSTDWYPPAAWL
ncbi:hypothetical protein QBZ16_001393 [Prototheca wickerhamii]|uniref:LicD/FKTN/FKRP nucleotidyltransferase domain-containing protein n=1 Tax=Prototheca wickerhamii TaxID=3111 RepID=A0AAD9IGY1_PROWI|nr:hypothetical protein QBZ16_001393 [Prototheca wickerhamii]